MSKYRPVNAERDLERSQGREILLRQSFEMGDGQLVEVDTRVVLGKVTKVQGENARAGELAQEPGAVTIAPAESYPEDQCIFKNQGKTWLVVYASVPKSVRHSVGMAYIARLLQQPGKELHAAALRATVRGEEVIPLLGSAGDVLDERALKEYRARLTEVDEELTEAEAHNDLGRQEKLLEEREALYTEIGCAAGHQGRRRRAADDWERARQSVSAAIHRALRAMQKEHEPLWHHLQNALKIGEFLSYQPDQPTPWII